MRRQRGVSRWWLVLPLAALAMAWWLVPARETASDAGAQAAAAPAPSPVASTASAPGVSLAALAAHARRVQVARRRLELAQQTLDTYRAATRYPPGARPLDEQPDQAYPNRPIVEDGALRRADGRPVERVVLRTTQERVFVQGDESVHLGVSVLDAEGRAQPLRVVRATAREIAPPATASTYPVVALNLNDEGADGDTRAGDGEHGVRLRPSAQGFAGLLGQLRVEVWLEVRGEQGFAYFDVIVTPGAPADWAGAVRESLQAGSLHFDLGVQVREPGRYVATGRVDDAQGRPFALLTFNDDLGAGAQTLRLTLFGKLVADAQPPLPLTLRDVEAFLLRPDRFPDRLLMPRRAGVVHASAVRDASGFSAAEWRSEQRDRYLAELQRDVADAQSEVDAVGR